MQSPFIEVFQSLTKFGKLVNNWGCIRTLLKKNEDEKINATMNILGILVYVNYS